MTKASVYCQSPSPLQCAPIKPTLGYIAMKTTTTKSSPYTFKSVTVPSPQCNVPGNSHTHNSEWVVAEKFLFPDLITHFAQTKSNDDAEDDDDDDDETENTTRYTTSHRYGWIWGNFIRLSIINRRGQEAKKVTTPSLSRSSTPFFRVLLFPPSTRSPASREYRVEVTGGRSFLTF